MTLQRILSYGHWPYMLKMWARSHRVTHAKLISLLVVYYSRHDRTAYCALLHL